MVRGSEHTSFENIPVDNDSKTQKPYEHHLGFISILKDNGLSFEEVEAAQVCHCGNSS
jgi:hypothetical protein